MKKGEDVMTIEQPTMRVHSECERRWFFGGGVHTWLAAAAETGGQFLLFEYYLDGGKATPLHQHPAADETFIMLDGEIRLRIADDDRKLGAGGVAVIPAPANRPRRTARPARWISLGSLRVRSRPTRSRS